VRCRDSVIPNYSLPGERLPIVRRERVREGGSEGEIVIGNLRAEWEYPTKGIKHPEDS